MKSLILKDLFNISHNAKTMIFILLILAFALIPATGIIGYICAATISCCMMVVTTFSFDDASKWDRYALILPLKRKDIVAGKYIVLVIFVLCGVLAGTLVAFVSSFILEHIEFEEIFVGVSLALSIAIISSSMILPVIFKFGAEKARMLMMVSFLAPALLVVLLEQLGVIEGVVLFIQANVWLCAILMIVVLLLMLILSYMCSCSIYKHKEIN